MSYVAMSSMNNKVISKQNVQHWLKYNAERSTWRSLFNILLYICSLQRPPGENTLYFNLFYVFRSEMPLLFMIEVQPH